MLTVLVSCFLKHRLAFANKKGGVMMPLTMAKIGEKNSIKRITGKDDIRKHLENLGFVTGEDVTIVSALAGNVILQIKNSRIALDKGIAGRIMI